MAAIPARRFPAQVVEEAAGPLEVEPLASQVVSPGSPAARVPRLLGAPGSPAPGGPRILRQCDAMRCSCYDRICNGIAVIVSVTFDTHIAFTNTTSMKYNLKYY